MENKKIEKNEKMVEDYLNHLESEGFSPHTIDLYKKVLARFVVFLGTRDARIVTNRALIHYREDVDFQRKKQSHKTKTLELTPVRAFLSYLNARGAKVEFRDTLRSFSNRSEDKQLVLPSKEDVQRFLTPSGDSAFDTLVHLLSVTGLRISEALSLERGKVQKKFSINGKGAKPRLIMCNDRVLEMVREYETTLPTEQKKLFPLTSRSYQVKFANRSRELGLKEVPITPHTLRHLFATAMLDRGIDTRILQRMLGHSSIATTQRYAHVSDAMLEKAYFSN